MTFALAIGTNGIQYSRTCDYSIRSNLGFDIMVSVFCKWFACAIADITIFGSRGTIPENFGLGDLNVVCVN
jgi:hypothetical protein